MNVYDVIAYDVRVFVIHYLAEGLLQLFSLFSKCSLNYVKTAINILLLLSLVLCIY